MIGRCLALTVALLTPSLAIVAPWESAVACSKGAAISGTTASSGASAIMIAGETQSASSACESESQSSGSSDGSVPIIDLNLDILCVRYAIDNGLDPYTECDLTEEELQEIAVLTETMIASAFRELPLPASDVIVQPPNGRTLVNFETNFYTEREPFDRTLRLLGQRVDLEITPAQFAWNFGDGGAATSTTPGSAYPDLEITHNYRAKGTYPTRVDTTYTATYRINGGPSRPVPGSVTIGGEPVTLEAVTAKPRLVG